MMQVLTESTRAAGASLVVVTHDPEIARWCSRTLLMQDGRITTVAATR
jgi:putative ABC transport system ATP-binding protein